MIRRCSTLLTMLAVVSAFGFGFQPTYTQADGIANYTLTTTNALPAPTGPPPGTPSVTLNSTLTTGSATVSVPSTTGVSRGLSGYGNRHPKRNDGRPDRLRRLAGDARARTQRQAVPKA